MMSSLIEFIWIWDKVQGFNLPRHHRMMARFLTGLYRDRESGLLMAFRNSGKSTIVGLFCAWLLLNNPDLRILILSADQGLARKMVHHIKKIIERHPLTRTLVPEDKDEWAAGRFTVRRSGGFRDPSVLACGLMTNITGCRADIIICDDVEVPKTCDTVGKREILRRKLDELNYILTPGGVVLYIGTPHTADTIYDTGPAGFLSAWRQMKLPLLKSDGTSAWPERFGLEQIDALKKKTGPRQFAAQMMLEPISVFESRLDSSRLKFYQGDLDYREANGRGILSLNGYRLCGCACWWDPAFGSPTGDKSVVACVFFDERGIAYIHRILYLTVPPDCEATAYQCGAVQRLIADCHIPAIHLETNGIGKFLPALLRQTLARSGTPCAVIEETSRRNKVERILSALDAPLMNGNLWVHESVRSTPFIQEMQDFKPGGPCHDDGLDAVAGCLSIEPVRLQKRMGTIIKNTLEWRF
ncbi:MAG: phage terminase large subunit [Alphaproteobacteria bacterium]|nr:phage terminase large subunit [Alphaproteobacteria bacterium]